MRPLPLSAAISLLTLGVAAPRHVHPNCDETLHVISGNILNTLNEVSVEMHAGDTVTIPSGTEHNSKNIGTVDAVLSISSSSANRQTVGEAAP